MRVNLKAPSQGRGTVDLDHRVHRARRENLLPLDHRPPWTPSAAPELREGVVDGRGVNDCCRRGLDRAGLPEALAAWRWRGSDGLATTLSAAVPLSALPVPGGEVRREPLCSLRSPW
jgi:hypothetical protein